MSSPILPMTGTALSQNPGIPVSRGNPSSYVRATGNGSTLSVSNSALGLLYGHGILTIYENLLL